MTTPIRDRTGRLLEREHELATIEALTRDAAAGDGRLALIEGGAGLGKSALLAEARRLAGGAGLRVLTARGSRLEGAFAFGVVRQLLEPLVADPAAGEGLLAGAAAPAAAVFGSPDDAPGEPSFATLHGLYWLVANAAAAGPLLLAIDDLHWADRASLRFAVYLARRLEGLPVLVAATLRSAEPGPDPALLDEIVHDPATVAVRPAALTADGTARLVALRLAEEPEPAFRDACHEATGGNPLLLEQLLSSLRLDGTRPTGEHVGAVRDIGPRAVSRALLLRLSRLPEAATAVARAVAVLGDSDSAGAATVAALAGVDEAALVEATRELVRADILRADAHAFVHPLVRDAIYADLPAAQRELLHGAAARLLRAAGADAQDVAAHLLVVGDAHGLDGGEVVALLREAGHACVGRGAPECAVAHLRRALAVPPPPAQRPALLLELGLAEAMSVDPAAVEHLGAAYGELEEPAPRALTAQVLGQILTFAAPVEVATGFVRQAIADMPADLEDARLRLEAIEMMAISFGAPDWREIRQRRGRREPPGPGPGAKALAALTAFDWAVSGGGADECASLALDALRDGSLIEADDGFVVVPAWMVLGMADRDEALEIAERVTAQAHRRGSLFGIATAHLWSGLLGLWRGDLVEAEANLRSASDDFALWGHLTDSASYGATFLAEVLLERGDVAAARTALDRGRPAGTGDVLRYWTSAHARVLLAEGHAEAALAAAREVAERWPNNDNPALLPWRPTAARALDALDRSDEAIALAREHLDAARGWGTPAAIGGARRLLGEVDRLHAATHLEEALELLARSHARLERAHAAAALGQALRLARRPTEAREPLREALDLAERCGAAGLVDRARTELSAAGARPRRTALTGVDALTTSERRVADLAASGRTNRDIAQALYVTPKTVEVHLSSTYRKLGIRSRTELARALADAA